MSSNNAGARPKTPPENSLANLLKDCVACGVVGVDGRALTARLTPQAARILGLGEADEIALAALPAPLGKAIAELLAAKGPVADRELDLQIPSRGPVTLRLGLVPLPASNPGAASALILSDLTSMRQFEQKMRHLDRLATLGTVAAGVVHEIKNALVSSRTFVDLLLEKQPEAELGHVVRREISRIEALLSQMLRLAAPAKPALRAVPVHEVLDRSLQLIGRQLAEKAISTVRQYAASSDVAQGDDYQLEQVFVNLFLNAADAMGPGGVLTVATSLERAKPEPSPHAQARPGEQLRITITDTGVGIPEENLRRLFEPFFTTKAGSTGLGLSISRRIVEEHGGAIEVESRSSQGTAFRVILPLPASARSPHESAIREPKS